MVLVKRKAKDGRHAGYLSHGTVASETRCRGLLSICGFVVVFVHFFLLLLLLRRIIVWNGPAKGVAHFFGRHLDIVELYQFWQRAKNNFTVA